MINLLTKIEQDYGLPVAISFAKQAIKHDLIQIKTLRRSNKAEVVTSGVISALLNWKKTAEGEQFWRDMYHRYAGIKFLLSYNDLEEYAAKNPNIKTVTIDTMQKILKEPKMAMIAPFNKGSLNIKGIIHQAAKGIKDDRPFVVTLIDEELERVKTIIKNTPRDTFNYKGYDIRVHYYVNQILAAKARLDAAIPGNICTPFINLSAQFVVDFYDYEKLVKKNANYSWIESYLTQENMQKTELTLFKSNKLHIFIEEGYIYLKDFTKNVIYDTPVMYDKNTNKFYL